MSSRSSTVLSGAVALILAVAVIAAAVLTGVPFPFTSKVINPSAPPGIFSILLTDPPYIPQGVTAIYITYDDLALHVFGLPIDSGWAGLSSRGTIDTLGLVNISQTISSTKVPAGFYNILRFNITSAIVTFESNNFTASVRNNFLIVPIIGGIDVNATKPSATLVDIQPAVINIGTRSAPEFVITTVARAAPVPSTAEKQISQVGYRAQLQSKEWFHQISRQLTSRFGITSASLTATSLVITVRNSNSASADLRLVLVSPILVSRDHTSITPLFAESAIFLVTPNGTLQQLQPGVLSLGIGEHARTLLSSRTGYQLASGAIAPLSYSGTITTSFGSLHKGNGITARTPYLITVIGEQLVVSIKVTSG